LFSCSIVSSAVFRNGEVTDIPFFK
jgi:hypothetical protein